MRLTRRGRVVALILLWAAILVIWVLCLWAITRDLR